MSPDTMLGRSRGYLNILDPGDATKATKSSSIPNGLPPPTNFKV